MRFSELRSREWINLTIDSDVLANQITMVGLEVNGIKPAAGGLHGVIVGEVVECARHPNTDKLYVTKVSVDDDRLLDIVCDAPGCRQGLHVAVMTIGAVLPGDFKIKAAKLRDEPSEGMLCPFSELEIPDDYNDIIELPADAPVGTDIREYLKLDDDTIEISVTPNHTNRSGIISITYDVVVSNQLPPIEPRVVSVGATIDDTLPVTVGTPDVCPHYLDRVVKGINVKASTPLWMKGELRRCGIHSIDAVVDVTNYMLLELDQPIHAFGKDRIEGDTVMWMAKEGEMLVLLDGIEAKLDVNTLVIADHNKALATGSMFGDEHSGVNDETQNVLLERAFFNPLSITGCARRHGLHIDTPHRYECDVGPTLQYEAMGRTTYLPIDICGGEASPVVNITNEVALPKRVTITLRRSKLDRLISHHIADEQVTGILRHLGYEVTGGKDEWQAAAPSWRFNIEVEEDLIEEVACVYGYDNIPDEPIQAGLTIGTYREADLSLKRVKILLNDKGYREVITYNFVNSKVQ